MKIENLFKKSKNYAHPRGIELSNEEISIVLKNYHEIMFDKLIKGEEVKIESIGKISTSIISMHSNFDQQNMKQLNLNSLRLRNLNHRQKKSYLKLKKEFINSHHLIVKGIIT